MGAARRRDRLLRHLVEIYYDRNDVAFKRGTFRVRGDTVDIFPAYRDTAIRVQMFGDTVERIVEIDPLTGEILDERQAVQIFPARHFVTRSDQMNEAIVDIQAELEERLAELKRPGQAAGGAAAGAADPVRPGDAARGGLLLGHRELFAAPRPPQAGAAAVDADRLFPRRFPAGDRRVAHVDPADPGHVQRRPGAQGGAGGVRLSPAVGPGQPPAQVPGVRGAHQPGDLYLGHARPLRAPGVGPDRGADHPAHRPDRSRDRAQADQGPDRRPDRPGSPPGRAGRAGAGDDADQADGRGPGRLSGRAGDQGPLSALRDPDAGAGGDPARPAAGGVRRRGRDQPAARGARPAGGVAGGDPRRRQGRVSALRAAR